MPLPILALDPGHGGSDTGAVGQGGLAESHIVLDICQTIKGSLHGVIDVRLTRSRDTFVSLSDRAAMANDWGADLFLSIHCNASEKHTAQGKETFSYPGSTAGANWRNQIHSVYCVEVPEFRDRGTKTAGFTVLAKTSMPAALLETCFIDEPSGEEWLTDLRNRDRVASAVCQASINHMNVGPATPPVASPANMVREHLEAIRHHADEALKLI